MSPRLASGHGGASRAFPAWRVTVAGDAATAFATFELLLREDKWRPFAVEAPHWAIWETGSRLGDVLPVDSAIQLLPLRFAKRGTATLELVPGDAGATECLVTLAEGEYLGGELGRVVDRAAERFAAAGVLLGREGLNALELPAGRLGHPSTFRRRRRELGRAR